MLDFDALRDARKAINEFCIRHDVSVAAFRDGDRPWFKVDLDEDDRGDAKVQHRTTAATCLESLDQANTKLGTALVSEIANQFTERVFQEPFDNWKSDGAAFVYCRVRTLPAIIRFAPELAASNAGEIKKHLSLIWGRPESRHSYGVSEATKKPEHERKALTSNSMHRILEHTYPPNAFHTSWALTTLHACKQLNVDNVVGDQLEQRADTARLWSQNMLSAQIAMHRVGSDEADPNQLAWALISQFIDPDRRATLATGELSREPLYTAALAAFFAQQLKSGKWPLGQPLFHYPRAGNAYCYTFETLSALIQPALYETRLGRLLRELLKPHLAGLLKAWEFAERTAQTLEGQDPLAVGWSSGHHPHRTNPEGWATASVFSYLQSLRCLVGAYARERAAQELDLRTSRYPAEIGLTKLVERGATWVGPTQWTASEQIAAMFLHPVQARHKVQETVDPDQSLICGDQARSAILFGPPGTSKTTLVEALAGAIGWDFVVVHASHFLSEGMDKVPSRADYIFERLMQLDRCVILFDEIDELLRNRQDQHADPFGRFLTTSMLPKVATLWEQRRVVFFVATNDITGADPAIKRSQRFDAAIFVAPPSFDVKKAKLSQALGADLDWLEQEAVESALSDMVNAENVLGYFALLRHDQLDELKDLVQRGEVDEDSVMTALEAIGERFKKSDWLAKDSDAVPIPPFQMFKEMRDSETRDHSKERAALVKGSPVASSAFEPFKSVFEDDEETWTYVRLNGSLSRPPASIEADGSSRTPDLILRYK